MDDREAIIEAQQTLYARLETLRSIGGPEMLLQERVESYRSILEDAYAAYGKIETAIEELGQELEYQHARLDEEVKKYG